MPPETTTNDSFAAYLYEETSAACTEYNEVHAERGALIDRMRRANARDVPAMTGELNALNVRCESANAKLSMLNKVKDEFKARVSG